MQIFRGPNLGANIVTNSTIMTAAEKENAAILTDEQIERIAKDANADKAILAIFINGFVIKSKCK